mmetsp:Transcript_11733/g.17773  ORF Transcript_11733/g.17773 Transcript_11733/m.17773 type:complete len:182 (-) Transcript_11733:146-691(-)|eukprot:CAMPEP_0185021906 /NCGR_PEP_ID=MMETSP1103-20130426/4610_1 /TAXON_ID=36769 /ORGANISM="Paraphysomonas bandaiensis, Strain Caron Lab Isolate" /LENGTH=181 /DNA_ID=CAMNT_0027553695 /DNA_START=157 /DNA_END=702 /DNA_ORIENTATION=-
MHQGFGICGHKNSYSSYVRDGNWNEDKYGAEILVSRSRCQYSYDTEYSRNHCDPRDMQPDPRISSLKLPSIEDIRAKNKDGMSYSLIFEHGLTPLSAEERFSTTMTDANSNFKKFAIPEGSRQLSREKILSRDMADACKMITESKSSTLRLTGSAPRSSYDAGRDVSPSRLPKWNRRAPKY